MYFGGSGPRERTTENSLYVRLPSVFSVVGGPAVMLRSEVVPCERWSGRA